MPADSATLASDIAAELGWERSAVDPIVEAICAVKSDSELEELIQIQALVRTFLDKRQGRVQSSLRSDPKGRQHQPGERQAGSVSVRHVRGRRTADTPAAADSSRPVIDREVCNCLCCGKIYFAASDTVDTNSFIASGGKCTFCGAFVSLTRGGKSETRVSGSNDAAPSTSRGESVSDDGAARQAAEEAARAFKDRLVDYDRNARQRTTVVDDQNDFFEIDTNAWLDPEEREILKRQEVEMREAEEARKRRITVTLDLLGRKVVMADDAPPGLLDARNAEASLAAAKATGAETRRGGGTATASALRTADRIRPNLPAAVERPLFVATLPETAEARRKRRGLSTAPAPDEAPQGVVGAWDSGQQKSDGRRLASYERDRLGRAIEPQQSTAATAGNEASRTEPEEKKPQPLAVPRRKAKRPQLKRLQHDDPFKDVFVDALDDTRPED